MKKQSKYSFDDLLEIVARLSAPDGCPWDREQTHQSICSNTIEEAYEVVDAIDKNDKIALIEELGDLLLQSVFHSDIAKRAGNFDMDDVLTVICDKLISRHSHIFGNDKATNAGDSISVWEKNKEKEKGHTSVKAKLESIPKNLPALMRASKVIKKLDNSNDSPQNKPITAIELEAELVTLVRQAVQSGHEPELVLNQAVNKMIDDLT
ncbi:MAG: MazG family protein [Firmicutes bacterium]|nr:MazG family protein [Bacillota bacterium]